MLPAFDIDGGLLLAMTRAFSVAALLSVFGTLVFRVFVVPRSFARMPADITGPVKRRLLILTRLGLLASSLGLLFWLFEQSADMASAASLAQGVAALPSVLENTEFGHLIVCQGLTVLVAAAIIGRQDSELRQRAALGIATVALGLQAGHSHAASMYPDPSFLLLADLVHLFGAGAWLGGLLPLLLVVRDAPVKAGALAARWFSPLGKLCLVALTTSALFQGWVLVESIPGLVGTAYGWMVLIKLGLFGVLFALALVNRYRFAPALLRGDPAAAKRVLVRSIAVQTGFGIAIVAAAGVLSSLAPAMHEQPVWPFPNLVTMDKVNENPEFRNEVLGAVLALTGAAVLLVIAVLIRRPIRWAALGVAAVITWFAVPHLDLLFAPAYPTSFYHSPTNFAATSIVQGAALYPAHCASCHGADGLAASTAAMGSPMPFSNTHLWMASDGELFWWLTHGIEAAGGGLAMPGFAANLSDDDRWQLIDYIRAYDAGVEFHSSGAWTRPVRAPELQAQCAGDRTVSLSDLRGGFVRLVIDDAAAAAATGVTTILATQDAAATPSPGVCVARDEDLPQAYAIVSGLTASELMGVEFLIDGDGWLRALQRPAEKPGWNDPKALAADIQHFAAHPIGASSGGNHAHTQM